MFEILSILCLGITIGFLFRKVSTLQKVSSLIFPIILLLLFSVGITIGMNEELLKNLHTLSNDALIITAGSLGVTLLLACLLWHFLLKHRMKP